MEKTKIYLYLLLLGIPAGCTLLENDLSGGRPRLSYERSRGKADSLNNAKSPVEETFPKETLDTTVFVSAVRCSPGYDWQRDTAYGCPDARILLFRNGEEVLSVPAGDEFCVSAAPDMHHIVDGHLYTEYCDYSRTVIGRDGTFLYTFPGRELLKGILPVGEDLHTLSESLSTGELIYRKNGEQVFRSAKSTVFGSFDDPSYGQTGALYEDSGAVCFAFRTRDGCRMVRDGRMSTVKGTDVFDVKSVRGKDIIAGSSCLGRRWKDARIWRLEGFYAVSGEGDDGISRVIRAADFRETQFSAGKTLVYCSGSAETAVGWEDVEKAGFCFSPRCATIVGSTLLILCTPRDGSCPYIMYGEKKQAFEGLDGFLTGLTGAVSLPSRPPLILQLQ